MKDSNNMYELDQGQSWQKAEKMLDRHFRKRRIIIWSASVFIAGLLILSSSMLVHKFSKGDSAMNGGNAASEQQSPDVTPVKKTDGVFISDGKKIAPVKSTVQDADGNVSEKEKMNETHLAGTHTEKRRTIQKAITSRVDVVAANSKQVKNGLKNSEKKYSVVKPAETATQQPGVNEESKTGNSFMPSLPGLTYLDPIRISEVPLALTGNYIPLSHSEEKSVTLPAKKCNLKLAVYAGAHYVNKHIESAKFSEYADRRKNEEEGIITTSFGASLAHEVKNFSIHVGIEYSSWGEKNLYLPYLNKKTAVENGHYHGFNTIDVDTIYVWGNQWFVYDTIPDSSFVSKIDTVTNNVFDASVNGANNINHYYFFEVPIEMSVRCNHGKIGLGATLGISPAWLITKKGYYLNKDVSGVELISDIKSVNTFIVNGRFSVDLYYRVCDHISMVLRPQLKANLNSIFKGDYGVNQRYYATGLLFGLEYSIK
jgi:hypothetical protein